MKMQDKKRIFPRLAACMLTIALLVTTALLIAPGMEVEAEEATTYEYYLNYVHQSSFGNYSGAPQYWNFDTIINSTPIYGYIGELTTNGGNLNNNYGLRLVSIWEDTTGATKIRPDYATGTVTRTHYSNGVETVNLSRNDITIGHMLKENFITYANTYNYILNVLSYDTNIPIFADAASLIAFLETGDDSGQVNKPEPDYSYAHDFSKDEYSVSIPVPEVVSASHEGFVLSNWEEGYYVDIIMESKLNGVEIKNAVVDTVTGNHYYTEYDPDWIYNSHYYNFTLNDIAVSQANINIKELYGIDNAQILLTDFKEWSVSYPKIQNLPTYSFLKYSYDLQWQYGLYHTYDSEDASGDLQQLEDSGQGVTDFYIRYYTVDLQYSQWIKYSVRPSYSYQGSILPGVLGVKSIDVDFEGNVTYRDNIIGSLDSSGNVSYDGGAIQTDKINIYSSVTDYWSILQTMYAGMGNFPGIINEIFGFLPSWVTTFMGISLATVILLRFIGR